MKTSEREITDFITDRVDKLLAFYRELDNSLSVNGIKINLKREKIKRVSFDDDVEFYFGFFSAISEYREKLKQLFLSNNTTFLNSDESKKIIIESRIKNINSIFSKIYQYINKKKENGDVAINKCLNDLFGIRIVVPIDKFDKLYEIVIRLAENNNWNCKIYDSSKLEYKAVHMYICNGNYSLRWEVQFWLLKDDASNRNSHARYKQAYTNWESVYRTKDLFRKCKP